MYKSFYVIILIAAAAVASFGQQTPQFDDIFNYYTAEQNFSGAAIVASGGKIEYLNGAGLANRQNGTTLNSKSKFRICSITKTFTAVLIMRLFEAGKIDLNAPVSRYLPDYKGAGKDKITIDNLLTYSSGLDNLDQRDESVYASLMSPETLIDKYFSGALVTEPGKQFSYKNADYIILGRIIEKIAGKPFSEVLQTEILKPLGMTNTDYLRNGDIVVGLANPYWFDKTSKSLRNEDQFWIDNFAAAGAMYSTVEDLLKFDQAIFDHKLLQPKTVDLMLTARPKLYNVGYGFWISNVKFGALTVRAADRQGEISGSKATWLHLIDTNKTVIILSNTNALDINQMREKFVLAALGQPINLPAFQQKVKTIASNDLSRLQGIWEIDLRPTPNSEPYLKDFVISNVTGKKFSGVFYGTEFTAGQFNGDWEKTYFAFTTGDKDSSYFHSGYIENDKIYGTSYSPQRNFVNPWSGKRKN